MSIAETLGLMISFGTFIISLLSFIFTIVIAMIFGNKK
ncbi:MAG: putative holin-like toxin [Gemella sp.]|nr:putative holin-like toxin [Gemella sp.]